MVTRWAIDSYMNVHVLVCVYLCSGSRILCTHWDRHSKQSKRACYMFLHSDRLVYRYITVHIHKETNTVNRCDIDPLLHA